jgi:SHS2 domain-containing protein
MTAARADVTVGAEPEGVRMIEHTADFGLEVEAPTLEALFARAAAGMFSSFAEADSAESVPPTTNSNHRDVPVELRGENIEELMVLWLDELLYRAEEKRLIFTSFEVESVSDTRFAGRAYGRLAARGETFEPPVKGVTHHDLWIRRENGGWRAHVIIDV